MNRKPPKQENHRSDGSLLIANARLLDPHGGLDAKGYLGIDNDCIAYIGKTRPKEKYVEELDAKGLWLMPGLVDLAARFREPGQTQKATIYSETTAARSGGITTVCLPPDTSPVVDTPAVVDRIHSKAQAAGGLDLHVLGALTKGLAGEALAEMSALKAAGCVGASNAFAPLANSQTARRALEYASGCGLTVHVFAQDAALANGGCAHEGPVATRLGLPPVPVAAEVAAIRLWISLVEDTGARVHFCRLSTARGAELIASAQSRKLPVTADVAAHQLFLTDQDVDGFNALCHVVPPLRSKEDRDALRKAVKSGVIAAICSDHQPHEADAKINPYPLTEPGISALETLLPLTLLLAHEGLLTALDAAARLSLGPARILGLPSGRLTEGVPAHLALVDPERRWRLDPETLLSSGHNTPFGGWEFRGLAVRTFHAGRTVFART